MLGTVIARRKRIGQGDIEALVVRVVVDDLLFAQAGILIDDQARHISIARTEQVKIATTMDQRNLVHGLVDLRAVADGEQVIVGPRPVVFVIHDGATTAVVDEARAIVADPHGICRGNHEMHMVHVRAAALQHRTGRSLLARSTHHHVNLRRWCRRGERNRHLRVQRVVAAPANQDALVRLVLGLRPHRAAGRGAGLIRSLRQRHADFVRGQVARQRIGIIVADGCQIVWVGAPCGRHRRINGKQQHGCQYENTHDVCPPDNKARNCIGIVPGFRAGRRTWFVRP
ncbi:MAG: hypothetical protein BWZ07_02901 [Alphaproteobacteria bacterium ADurb.BinA280]|nr:MAG: hypothetical protein BWZ07_02901 [Alphaproteobacteria bacterium ADurb.BinA280]